MYGGMALVLLVIAWAALVYFLVETQTVAWHVQHGFHAEVGGIRMRVPLSYVADDPQGLPSLTLTRRGGRLWRGGATIMIDFRRPSPAANQAIEAKAPPNELIKRNKLDERTLTFAGRSGTCVEYVPQLADSRVNAILQEADMRDIDCWFGGVEVELLGTASLREDLYYIIQTAEPIGRKN